MNRFQLRNDSKREAISELYYQAISQSYEKHRSLDTGDILRLHLTHRFGRFSLLNRFWLGADAFLCVPANVLFLCRLSDIQNGPRAS